MRLRAVLRATHLWVGLALSLLLLLLGLSGSALVYKEAYWRLVHPELREPRPELSAGDHAAAIVAAADRFGDALLSVKLPEPGVAAYHLYLADGEAFLALDDHEVIDRWRPTERPMALLFDLHAHLMAGDAGERVGGVIALLGTFMLLTGVYLWWPARRQFGLRTLLPTVFARRKLLPSHRDLGILAAPILLVLLLTGAAIVFYAAAGTLLNGLLPGGAPMPEAAPEVAAAEATESTNRPRARPELLRLAAATFPRARIVFYYPPNDAGIHGFRMKQPCELHPNGRTYVYMTGEGDVVRSVDACRQPSGQRALHAMYPLHSGKTDSGIYKLLVFAGGLALTLVSATGAAAYLAKLAGRR